MQSIKLHEATKQFRITNKLAMFFLERMNIPVKSHSSVISMEQLEQLREFARKKDETEIYKDYIRLEEEKKKRKKAKLAKKEAPTAVPAEAGEAGDETVRDTNVAPLSSEEEAVKPPAPPEAKAPEAPAKPEEPKAPTPPPRIIKAEARVERIPQSEARPPRDRQPAPAARREEGGRPEKRRIDVEGRREPRQDRSPHSQPQGKTETRPAPSQDMHRPKPTHPREPRPGATPPHEPRRDRPAPKKQGEPPRQPIAKNDNKDAPKAKPADRTPRRDDRARPETPSGNSGGTFQKPPQGRPGMGKGGPQDRDRKNKRQDHYKGKKRHDVAAPQKSVPVVRPKPKPRVYNLPASIQVSDFISVKELAEKMNLKLRDIEDKMGAMQKEYVTNRILEVEDIMDICNEFKVEVDMIPFEDAVHFADIETSKAQLVPRAPVITVMGHVDHGKTTLLDTLRNTRVAAREAGGITQKIGAYKLTTPGGSEFVFLDTPGHEAFTNIRARGAKITDIVILVVAANDGVQPQTIEAINHARAAEVPLVVAVNKIDLPGADPNRVKQELTQHNILVEDWGGDVVCVEISAKENQNLDSLLEMIDLSAEMLELKSYKDIPARGTIIESRLDPKLGPLGTVLIQHGKVKTGDYFICGNSVGKVKSVFNDQGDVLKSADAPLPIEIMGFESVPEAGELFQVTSELEKAKKVIDMRLIKEKEAKKEEVDAGKKISLQNLFERLSEKKIQEFPLIIKADNFSSCEVLETILLKQNQERMQINIIHKGIGNITESDVLLASTSNSILIGFNVKAPQKILGLAKREQVEIKLYNVIYHLIEDIEKAIKGEIEPEYVELHIGKVEVLQTFKISKLGIIAGYIVREGKVTSKSRVKVLRGDDLVFEGELETLRRIKNDVSEVKAGTECGIKIRNFNAVEVGDIFDIYESRIKE